MHWWYAAHAHIDLPAASSCIHLLLASDSRSPVLTGCLVYGLSPQRAVLRGWTRLTASCSTRGS
jgi:hypothetical protein